MFFKKIVTYLVTYLNVFISFVFSLAFSLVFSASVANAQQAYIKIGQAQTKKSQLAFPFINQTNAEKTGQNLKISSEIHNVTKKDLELSTYFNIMPTQAFLEDTSSTSIKSVKEDARNGFKYDTWKTIGAEFLVRSSMALLGDEINLEMYLYSISETKVIVGKKYTAKVSRTADLGHTMANDIIEALTGKRAVFLSKIVATSDASRHKEVVVMNWDGSDIITITKDKNIAMSPNWSPDGSKVLYSIFTRKVGSARQNLTLFQQDLSTGKRVILSNRDTNNTNGAYSPDGKFVYMTIGGDGTTDIYKLNLKGEIVQRLTKGPAGSINVEPAVSKDGSKIAFSSDRGGNPSIYVMNSDGSNVKRLTFQGKFNSTPTWSPDGSQIAFAGQNDSNFDIFIMNADGSNLRKLTSGTRANGRKASFEDPSFSPDGRFITYTSNRTGKFQIYVMSVDGSEERRVTNDSNNYFKPRWSNNLE